MYRLPPAASGPGFRALLDYWIARFPTDAAGDRLPGRQHIDPAELPPRYLAHLLLLQVVPGSPRRFRFRVAGTAFSAIAGRDVTGLHCDEIGTPEQVAPALAAFDLVVERAGPVFLEGALSFPPKIISGSGASACRWRRTGATSTWCWPCGWRNGNRAPIC